MKHLV